MLSGIAKLYYIPAAGLNWNGLAGSLATTVKQGYAWKELTDLAQGGTLSTKSTVNPCVDSFTLEASLISTLAKADDTAIKRQSCAFKVVTKEGETFILGSPLSKNKVSCEKGTGESVGDFQGIKVIVEGVMLGKLVDASQSLPENKYVVDTNLDGFRSIFASNLGPEFPGISSFLGIKDVSYPGSSMMINIDFNSIHAILKNVYDNDDTPGLSFYANKNWYVNRIWTLKGNFKISVDIETDFEWIDYNKDVVILTFVKIQNGISSSFSEAEIHPTYSTGKLTAIFSVPATDDVYLHDFKIKIYGAYARGLTSIEMTLKNFRIEML